MMVSLGQTITGSSLSSTNTVKVHVSAFAGFPLSVIIYSTLLSPPLNTVLLASSLPEPDVVPVIL